MLTMEHNRLMRAKPILFLLLAALAIGCGASQQSLVGKYKGEVKMPESSKDDPMAKMGEAMLGMFTFDLELKEANKFTLMFLFFPIEGEWSVSGNVVTLTPKTVMGLTPEEAAKQNEKDNKGDKASPQDIEKMKEPIRLEVQPDGSLKALGDIGGEKTPGDLLFVKQKS
jgi:hypothetical protein